MKVLTGKNAQLKLHLNGAKDAVLLDQYAEFLIDTKERVHSEKFTNLKDLFTAADVSIYKRLLFL
jgi:hypothetical protein